MRRPMLVTLSGLVLTSALTGCGGGGSSAAKSATPTQWTSALCGGLASVTADQKTVRTDLAGQTTKIKTDPGAVRDSFAAGLKKLADDFSAARDRLDKAGAPAVTNGPELQKRVLGALDQGGKLFSDAETQIASASADTASVSTALTTAGKALVDGGKSLQTALTAAQTLDTDKAIDNAGRNNPDCKALSGG